MFSGQIEFQKASQDERIVSLDLACCLSERLSIRPLMIEDANSLFSLTDANRDYLRQWLPWLDSTLSSEDTRAFIKQKIEQAQLGQELVSTICYDQVIVGLIGLHNLSWDNWSGSMGYWLSAAHQGRGIMTRACRSMMDYGFSTLNLNRIDICCAVGNTQSEAVAKRLGLTFEGTLRETEWLYDHFVDHKLYSLLSREWRLQLTS